jgi:rfaE bifunctional protein nucleotidyltransferase chain/domain
MGELDYIRHQKILSLTQIEEKVNFRKHTKHFSTKIIFTNGCFDVLHLGHIEYLAKAKEYGDFLIVGLNSDESVRKLKGETRPINDELSRATILASLSFIDAVVIFNEETPEKLIKTIRPDILVKGGDYTEENIVGSEFVRSYDGDVKIIDLVDGYSSTNIINKLKNSN